MLWKKNCGLTHEVIRVFVALNTSAAPPQGKQRDNTSQPSRGGAEEEAAGMLACRQPAAEFMSAAGRAQEILFMAAVRFASTRGQTPSAGNESKKNVYIFPCLLLKASDISRFPEVWRSHKQVIIFRLI